MDSGVRDPGGHRDSSDTQVSSGLGWGWGVLGCDGGTCETLDVGRAFWDLADAVRHRHGEETTTPLLHRAPHCEGA